MNLLFKRKLEELWFIAIIIMSSSNLSFSQVFQLNTGYTMFNATHAGTAGSWKGKVFVRKAPVGTGNVAGLRTKLAQANIPYDVINSRIANPTTFFAKNIAQMPAMQAVANKLQNRQSQYTGGGIVIDQTSDLTPQNLNKLKDNVARTFIFRGHVRSYHRLKVGDNKTIWIDGTVQYTGPLIPNQTGLYGEKEAGLFELVGTHSNKIENVTFNGTKRSKLITWSRAPAIYAEKVKNLRIQGVNFYHCYNSISLNGGENIKIYDNFIYKDAFRAIHFKVVKRGSVAHNLTFKAKLDGIDIDALTSYANVFNNVFFGGKRFKAWIEIGSHHNIMKNNIGIHDPALGASSGGMQENGSELYQPHNTHHNTWESNNVFYANDNNVYQGITMSSTRKVNRNTIKFDNNYVWTERNNAKRHNPIRVNNMHDVKFLTKGTPMPSAVNSRVIATGDIVTDAINNKEITVSSTHLTHTNTIKNLALISKVYPNPVVNSGQVYVDITLPANTQKASISLMTITGIVVLDESIQPTNGEKQTLTVDINTLNLTRGTYLLRVVSDEKYEVFKITY